MPLLVQLGRRELAVRCAHLLLQCSDLLFVVGHNLLVTSDSSLMASDGLLVSSCFSCTVCQCCLKRLHLRTLRFHSIATSQQIGLHLAVLAIHTNRMLRHQCMLHQQPLNSCSRLTGTSVLRLALLIQGSLQLGLLL